MNQALRKAFDEHQEALLGFIQKRTSDPETAKDLLHDLYLKIEAQNENAEVKYPKAYLFRIANNLIVDKYRRDSRTPEDSMESSPEQSDENSPEKIAQYKQQLSIVTDAINELPEKTRDVFRLQRLQQVEKAAVASQMGISVNMVEKHLRKALAYCLEKLKKIEN